MGFCSCTNQVHVGIGRPHACWDSLSMYTVVKKGDWFANSSNRVASFVYLQEFAGLGFAPSGYHPR